MENNKDNNQRSGNYDNNYHSQQLVKFLGKVAVGAIATSILTPPVAMFIASYTYGTAKCMEYLVEEEDKDACQFVSNCAKDVIVGGMTGGVLDKTFNLNSSSIASQTTKLLGNKVGKEIAQNGVSLTSESLITTGQAISAGQKLYKGYKKYKEVKNIVKPPLELVNHKIHLDKGNDYSENCEVCNV